MHNILTRPADSADPKRAGDTVIRVPRYVLLAIPVTLAVVAGPPITIVYRLTRSADAATGSFSVAQAARGLLCILMFSSLLHSTGLSLLKHRLIRPLLFLAAYAVVTSFAGLFPYENIVFAVKMIFITLVFANAFHLAEEGLFGERWLTACAWIVLLIIVLNTGIGLAIGRSVGVYESPYATAGLIDEPSVASALTLSVLPVFLKSVPNSSSAIAGVVFLLTSLFFTMCRSSLIAAVAATCGSFVISLSSFRHRIPRRRVSAPAGILILLAVIGLNTPAGADLIARFRDLNPLEGAGSGRYFFWQVSLKHIVNRPMYLQLQGEGMGSIRDVIGQQTGLSIGAHNDWLDLVHSFGLFGLIGISWWYSELARLAWRFRDRRDGLFQGACATLIMLGLISIGTGGIFEPSWALSYAALGFWAGRTERISSGPELDTRSSMIKSSPTAVCKVTPRVT